ncbi:hypothetical protein [Marinifaba aquimaris]|uniref:hypothetical protein n=1 Tax=Marinifaba aquimaris TaxID=2741323 RepID=UPI0015732C66|nr:hypothetical protein [Marinifaba aquimaris]
MGFSHSADYKKTEEKDQSKIPDSYYVIWPSHLIEQTTNQFIQAIQIDISCAYFSSLGFIPRHWQVSLTEEFTDSYQLTLFTNKGLANLKDLSFLNAQITVTKLKPDCFSMQTQVKRFADKQYLPLEKMKLVPIQTQ